MNFESPLLEGRFVKRYKRFFADIVLNGETITALVPNTGSLKSCLFENAKCYVSFNDAPHRKLKYTLEMIETPTGLVGINTSHPNDLVFDAFQAGKVKHWKNFRGGRKEFKINDKSRLDMILWDKTWTGEKHPELKDLKKNSFHFIEVKNTTFKKDGAHFPDSVTTRGQKHLKDLMDLVKKGHTSEIVFVIQRRDVEFFSPADEIDPEYGKLLREANKKGVKITPFLCHIDPKKIEIDVDSILPVKF